MSIFEVTPSEIECLSDTDLRTLVGYLAEQELRMKGHSAAAVTYGGHQNAADGGIDVRVDLEATPITGFVPRPKTGFQVKAEDMAPNAILPEMCPGGELRESIIELGKANGAYVLVSSKGSVSDSALKRRRKAMLDASASLSCASGLYVDFYDRQRIATWVNQHAGLVPWVKTAVGSPFSGWKPYADWSSSPGSPDEEYILDDQVRLLGAHIHNADGLNATDGLARVRETLGAPKGVARLVGLSGVGKTRFVQAIFDHKIGSKPLSPHLAIYTDLAESPDPSPLELLRRLIQLKQRCVLIIDNCGLDLHARLSAIVREDASLASVITVEYDISDNESEGTEVFKLEPASAEVTEKIIGRKFPALSAPEVATIASFSEGNSRIAIALANTARVGESLANLKDSELFKRLFRQNHDEDPALLRAAKVCSLVYSFDIETTEGNEAELPVLALLAEQTHLEFRRHMAELQRRDLLQRRSKWRALLPHALAHRLAKQALEDLSPNFVEQTFTNQAPERLLRSFSKRLGFLHDSPEARTIVRSWLTSGGYLFHTENLNAFGLTVFENIAPIDPEMTLVRIEQAIEKLIATDVRGEFQHKLTHLLRFIAYDTRLFDRATWALSRFVDSPGKSNNSDDPSNIFASLFYIYLSGTQAPPRIRSTLLRRLAGSNHEGDRARAILGLSAMLKCDHFTSTYGFEFGAWKRDFGLHPRSQMEFLDWYKAALDLCMELDKQKTLRSQVRIVLAQKFADLARCTDLAAELSAVANAFSEDGGWPEGWVGVLRALAAARANNRESDIEILAPLAERLRPRTLSQRITTYVLPEQWSQLDVSDIDQDDPERFAKAREYNDTICADIGRELASDRNALTLHLPTLMGSRSQSVWKVAMTLAQEVENIKELWDMIVAACLASTAGDNSPDFLTPYILGASLRDREIAESLLDDAIGKPMLHPQFVRMQSVAGVNKRGLDRLLAAASMLTIPTWTFSNLQGGRACDALSGRQLSELLLAICERDDGIGPALDIMGMRIFGIRSDKKAVSLEDQAAGRELLRKVTFQIKRNNDAHHLASIVRACLRVTEDGDIAEKLCNGIMSGNKETLTVASNYTDVIGALATSYPRVVLDIFIGKSSEGEDGFRNPFRRFREDRPYPLDYISDEILIEWATERPEKRFASLAEVIRPWRKANAGAPDDGADTLTWSSISLLLIKEGADPCSILDIFYRRFRPSGWSGSMADILASRQSLLEELKDLDDPRVSGWATSAAVSLQSDIANWREWEARDRRSMDERFEH